MKYLFVALAVASITACGFHTESPGEIENGVYISHFDSISYSQHYIYDWEIRFSYHNYYSTEIESRYDIYPNQEKRIWMRHIRRETGKYSLDSGRIIYRNVRFGFKILSSEWDGEEAVLSLKPSNIIIESPYDFKISDSLEMNSAAIWKSQVQQFNTRKMLFRFQKVAAGNE